MATKWQSSRRRLPVAFTRGDRRRNRLRRRSVAGKTYIFLKSFSGCFLDINNLILYYLRRKRLCFYFGLFVCSSDNWKSCERILTKFLGRVGHGPGINEFNVGQLMTIRITVRIQESEVRNPDSLDYRITNWFWLNFVESWSVALRPTDNILVTKLLHHYPDPGVRSGSRSGSGKNCHNSIMLAFGGGLCSLGILLVYILATKYCIFNKTIPY